ncbi:hypothetical protein [Fundidesulfovibrio putealis]|uniref:hypothetical protein n=1 Tax=Fundidesulfovibrio putealis TaxID=270496 RepID=UPI000488F722|nr:hypothetical protein [Fundidesulfovibrio putealis]
MLVLSVEQSAALVESAIGDLGSVVGSHDPVEIKAKSYAAWKKLGEARALLRRPDLFSPQPAPVTPGACPEVPRG